MFALSLGEIKIAAFTAACSFFFALFPFFSSLWHTTLEYRRIAPELPCSPTHVLAIIIRLVSRSLRNGSETVPFYSFALRGRNGPRDRIHGTPRFPARGERANFRDGTSPPPRSFSGQESAYIFCRGQSSLEVLNYQALRVSPSSRSAYLLYARSARQYPRRRAFLLSRDSKQSRSLRKISLAFVDFDEARTFFEVRATRSCEKVRWNEMSSRYDRKLSLANNRDKSLRRFALGARIEKSKQARGLRIF